jgi:predicted ATP-grasp superfamily ATP-dependent carboligase
LTQTILLTCGRGTYSLTLARAFHAAGHRVLVADAWPRTLCRHSAAVDQYFHLPSPAQATSAWVAAVLRIVKKQRVNLIVPVYEEVFYLARAMASLSDPPPLFAADFETLIGLHNKWLFIQKTRALGLPVPKSTLLTSRDDLLKTYSQGGRDRVFKPVYSRFAAQTLVRPPGIESFDGIEPTPRRPWVAQDFLSGRPFATFSIAHRGRITAHATYATDFCHNFGPTVVYRRADQPAIFEWVRSLVEALEFTGQIGLDFIEDEMGGVSAIECNPRLTGGLYLLKDDPQFADAYFDPEMKPIEATRHRSYAFRFWLMLTLLRHTKSFPGFKEWSRHVLRARSTNAFTLSDPVPRLMGPFLAGEFLHRCFTERKTVRQMVTRDFEWNEDPAQIGFSAESVAGEREAA